MRLDEVDAKDPFRARQSLRYLDQGQLIYWVLIEEAHYKDKN